MSSVLEEVYGSLFVVRPPAPVNVNRAGANYKSEVAHLEYSPRRAFDEWLGILEGILEFGGDALFDLEEADLPYLDRQALAVEADGTIRDQRTGETLGNLDRVLTGRVFSANGPWVTVKDRKLSAVLPHMLEHRRAEGSYYRSLVERIAEASGLDVEIRENPRRWEGMADVAVVGDRVVLTHTVRGHYDEGVGPKSMRSDRAGVAFAADFAGVPEEARIYAELIYPHFHGDTVHFGVRPRAGAPRLAHYAGGLYGDGAAIVKNSLGSAAIVPIDRDDAVEQYAGNSRQVESGVLVPDGVSARFTDAMEALGLSCRRVSLFELFGKAGGGPACATLYLPRTLDVPKDAPMRHSNKREEMRAHRARVPERVEVDPGFFRDRPRG